MITPRLVSVVVPFYNEEGTVEELHKQLVPVLSSLPCAWEIIFVDDGSRDRTFPLMTNLRPIIAIRLKKNSGQTQALAAGIRYAHGDIIITMDGDLENDPADIPLLFAKLKEGYDIVTGWRKNRWKEKTFQRRLPSALANALVSWVSGVKLHDHGCNLRAYQKDVFRSLKLSGEMHRMIPAYAIAAGAQVIEIPVRFEPRRHGVSKYGLSRIFKVLLDILALHFFHVYAKRPIHFFGGIGFGSLLLGGGAFFWMLSLKYFHGVSFIKTPLPMLSALFFIISFQFILMGLLAEIIVRNTEKKEEEGMIAEHVVNAPLKP